MFLLNSSGYFEIDLIFVVSLMLIFT
jgi:hypothetical protein